MSSYKPITAQQLTKFAGIKTYMRLPHCRTTQGIDFAVVNVKAKTNEGLGDIGAGTAIASTASVLLRKRKKRSL